MIYKYRSKDWVVLASMAVLSSCHPRSGKAPALAPSLAPIQTQQSDDEQKAGGEAAEPKESVVSYRDYSNKPLPGPDSKPDVRCVGSGCPASSSGGKATIAGKKATPKPVSCPSGMSPCQSSNGGSSDCCSSNEHCMVYDDDHAGCMPNDQSACPTGKVFCPSSPLKSGDSTCCDPSTETCETFESFGYSVAYCKVKNCKKPNRSCGPKCCSPEAECQDRGCSRDQCDNSKGENLCTGSFNICCKENEICMPGGAKGNPNCFPRPTPPPTSPTSSPSPSSSPTPTGSPNGSGSPQSH